MLDVGDFVESVVKTANKVGLGDEFFRVFKEKGESVGREIMEEFRLRESEAREVLGFNPTLGPKAEKRFLEVKRWVATQNPCFKDFDPTQH